jgi:hypothetical protein
LRRQREEYFVERFRDSKTRALVFIGGNAATLVDQARTGLPAPRDDIHV